MSFNELLTEAGDFGLYQKFLCFGFLWFSIMVSVFTYWTNVFMLLVAPHRCRLSPNDTWGSDLSQYHDVVVGECDVGYNGTWDDELLGNEDFSTTYQTTEESGNSTWMIIPCTQGWVYDYSVFYPTISTEKDWVCENSWKMYILHSWYWAGTMCGFIFFGTISDRFGRKKAYQASILLTLVSDVCAIFVNNRTAFTVARFFSSMGQSSIPTLAFVLAIEYTGPRRRLFVLAGWCLTWTTMSALVPVVPYFLRYWRWLLAACNVPCTVVLLLTYFMPESASWLITRGRLDDASRLIHRVATVNGKEMDIHYIKKKLEEQAKQDVQLSKIKESRDAAPNGNHDDKKPDEKKQNLSYIQAVFGLFKTPNLRKKTILLVFIWMIACMCYNGNSIEVSNLPFNLYLSYSIGAMLELPANIFCLLTLDKIGRRWANFGFLLIAGILGITSGLLKTDSHIVLILALVMRSALAGGYDITFTFSSESFPTEVRGRGISLIRAFGGIGSCIAPFIVSLSSYDPLLPLVGFGILTLFAAGATLFLPETARQHLPHTLEEGEEYGKDQIFFFCPFSQEICSSISNIPGDLRLKDDEKKDVTGRDNPAMETNEQLC